MNSPDWERLSVDPLVTPIMKVPFLLGLLALLLPLQFACAQNSPAGRALSFPGGSLLFLTRQPRSVQLTWSGDPRNQLETTSDLTDQKWSKVPGGTGTNTVSLPVEAPPAFFRVVP